MANRNNPVFELLQLLTVLGVQVDNDDSLARVSPAFLESKVQTYLGFAQSGLGGGGAKLSIEEMKDIGEVSLKAYEMVSVFDDGEHGHGHSHDDGDDHGHDHSHGAGAAHSHSHDGGHGDSGHGHGHTHGGEPCSGHGDEGGGNDDDDDHDDHDDHDDEDEDEEDDDDDDDDEADSGPPINQVLRALRHYLSVLTQGIQQAWSRPPLFPGAPRHNIWVLREPTRDGKPSPTNLGHDLVLTIAGASTTLLPLPPTDSPDQKPTPLILLHYTHDSPAARKGLWGNTMQMSLPREILHLLSLLLEANSKRCPAFKTVAGAQVGTSSNGFKPSFLVPVREEHPEEEKIKKLDLKKETIGKLVGCDVCGLLGPDLKCAKCKGRTYCSAGCQRKDWKEHKGSCGK